MTVVVWIFVHNDKIPLPTVENKSFPVLIGVVGDAENAGIGFGTQNIFHAPRAPEVLHTYSLRLVQKKNIRSQRERAEGGYLLVKDEVVYPVLKVFATLKRRLDYLSG